MARLSGSMWKSGDYKIHNGSIEDIPFGWVLASELCDRAIVGAGGEYDHKQIFGTDSVRPDKPSVSVSISNHTLSVSQMPSHNHAIPETTAGGSDGDGVLGDSFKYTSTNISHPVQTTKAGSSKPHNHGATATVGDVGTVDTRQKSIALIWIRKL